MPAFARQEAKSMNLAALEPLERGLGLADEPVEYHDLDDLAGSWIQDPEFEKVVAEMDRVDPGLWDLNESICLSSCSPS